MLHLHITISCLLLFFFFFNDTATTEIYTLSLHDALPISSYAVRPTERGGVGGFGTGSVPSAVKTTALSVKDDREAAWPGTTVPLLPTFEKTVTAADRTNI